MALFVGLMSGTSLDGVDGVLAEFDEDLRPLRIRAHAHMDMREPLRSELLALNAPGSDELHRAALAGQALAGLYAQVTRRLLEATGLATGDITAIGAHGQTVRHRPGEFDGQGYTLQLLNGAALAEATGIDVVCDLRSADVAAHGQGAPLVPAFHAACLAQPGRSIAALNVGGIANLTLLHADGRVGGFDCGPGNVLMDLWIQSRRGRPYDEDGRWAASSRCLPALLAESLADPFFERAPPKSTGRDLFDRGWLQARLDALPSKPDDADVMATLAELTAASAATALNRFLPDARELLVCGGGACNVHLMQRLQALLPAVAVQTTASRGIPVDQVEALAFAWLAACRLARRPASLPAVTGAAGPRVLGAWHAASR